MECFYINLDSANERKIRLEQSFSDYRQEDWRLHRFPAIDAAYLDSHPVPGTLKPGEKGCFLSHKKILEANLKDEQSVFVLEDDVVFGKHTCKAIDDLLRGSTLPAWDIAFTDVCVPLLSTMTELLQLRHRFSATGQIIFLDLANMVFAGSAAYVVNGKSKRKLAALLDARSSLDIPYDLYLRRLIYERKLLGFVLFPFVTSLSEFSETSQVQPDDGKATASLLWNTFRKMIWMDRDLENQRPILTEIADKLCDDESRLFGAIFSAMSSRRYQP